MALSALAELDVKNLALDHLVERPLATAGDDNAYARWLTRNYDHLRDAFLRQYAWNFSVVFDELAEDATAPDFRWSYRYPLPTDNLRVLPPTYLGRRGGKPVPHEILDGFILCDVSSALPIRYVDRVEDTTKWDPLALEAFALFLALRMTYRFTNKATLKDRIKEDYKEMLAVAHITDAGENTPEEVEQHDVLDVRDM